MRKILPIVVLFAALMLLSACASADQAAPTPAAAPADQPAAAESAEPVDLLVGSWRMPQSEFGDDGFTVYVVLNADGSFLNATNIYDSGNSGSYTQKVSTNETFRWERTGNTSLELHYSYLDDNGEFLTELTYNPREDALYFGNMLYATRDDSFVLVQ